MSQITADTARPLRSSKRVRVAVRSTRPAIVDLRFREDPWVVAGERHASVCLGDYRLSGVAITSLDVPALNRLFLEVRVGQARRQMAERQERE
jgi:hypothetical protein